MPRRRRSRSATSRSAMPRATGCRAGGAVRARCPTRVDPARHARADGRADAADLVVRGAGGASIPARHRPSRCSRRWRRRAAHGVTGAMLAGLVDGWTCCSTGAALDNDALEAGRGSNAASGCSRRRRTCWVTTRFPVAAGQGWALAIWRRICPICRNGRAGDGAGEGPAGRGDATTLAGLVAAAGGARPACPLRSRRAADRRRITPADVATTPASADRPVRKLIQVVSCRPPS